MIHTESICARECGEEKEKNTHHRELLMCVCACSAACM